MRIFLNKKTRSIPKFFIHSMPHRLLYIFHIFRTICVYQVSKILRLLLRTIYRVIFSHLRTNRRAAQQVRDSSMQTFGNGERVKSGK